MEAPTYSETKTGVASLRQDSNGPTDDLACVSRV